MIEISLLHISGAKVEFCNAESISRAKEIRTLLRDILQHGNVTMYKGIILRGSDFSAVITSPQIN